MKTKIFNIISILLVVCGFMACNEDRSGSMDVNGDCRVQQLVLNNEYVGTIDMTNRLIKVKVPATFNTKNDMVVTSMTLSPGASSNVRVGDHLNMESDKNIHITSGSLVMDYRLAVRNDEAKLTNFVLEGIKGAINEEAKTVTVSVLANSGIDLSSATFEVTCSEDATCFPSSGSTGDFSDPANPFQITLTDNTAVSTYTILIDLIQRPTAVFVGSAETVEGLNEEEKAAAKWLTSTIQGAAYLSWRDIANSEDILDECKFIFFHRQVSAYNTLKNFKDGEPGALEALPALNAYWKRGGAFVLQRMGVDLAAALGAMPEDGCPNNCWGGTGEGGPKMDDNPWTLPVFDKTHALWQGLVSNPNNPDAIYTLDKDYTICNSASQYHWDGLSGAALFSKFDEVTGGKARRLVGNDNEVSSWELQNANGQFGKGGIICLGSGLLDWYSPTEYVSVYHENMGTILLNAYHYLTGE